MRFNLLQVSLIGVSLLSVVLLLSFGRIKPINKKGDDRNATDTLPPLNDESMLAGARKSLDSTQTNFLVEIERNGFEIVV